MKAIEKAINWLTIGLVFLLPVFFLSITAEFFVFNKQALLVALTGVMTLLWVGKMALSQTLSFRRTTFDLPIIIFAIAFVITGLLSVPNKFIPLAAPTGTGMVLTLTLLYFVITNNVRPSTIRYSLYAFIGSATLLGLIAVYQYIGIGQALIPAETAPWLANKLFTPAGSSLVLISVLVTALALAITTFLKQLDKKQLLITAFAGGASVIIAIGLIITIYQVLPGKDTSLIMLSYPESWAIGIEAFKRNPLFGIGPGNYLSAFNRFRPVTFNNNDFWNVRFGNASSFPLELLTVGGLLALGAYLFVLFHVVRLWLKTYRQQRETQLPLLITIALAILIPWLLASNFILLAFSFIFLAMFGRLVGQKEVIRFKSKTLSLIILGAGLVLILPSFYLWGRVYAADMAFRQSLDALARNQGIEVYNQQIRAISLNPYSPTYRRAYSQTNFALANSIAAQPDLTDQDRNNITQLIQQAIREAKIAANLNPFEAANWENLAQIYRNLLNFAQGADQWAIAAYQQSVATDPINPRIRVNLGGLFYSLQDYEAAIRQFQNAIDLKPDFANGYYNLAAAYRERGMYQQAYQAMQIVVSLVPGDSADYQRAVDELDELAKQLPEASPSAEKEPAKPEEALTEPQPLPSPVIEPPIELPEEAGPEISPTPSPPSEPTPTS